MERHKANTQSESVYICLGSNLGDRYFNIIFGLERLRNLSLDGQITSSPIYETRPWGPVEQGPFLNCAVCIYTNLAPLAVHKKLLSIEREAGRQPGRERWGPRELDMDILLFGERVVNSLQLTIPHPRLTQRRFALVPLCDLIPDRYIPVKNLTVHEALDKCLDDSWVRLFNLKESK